MVRLQGNAEGTILPVRAQPGARCQGVLGEHDGALRVAVTAAPDKGKANQPVLHTPTISKTAYKTGCEALSGCGLSGPLPLPGGSR